MKKQSKHVPPTAQTGDDPISPGAPLPPQPPTAEQIRRWRRYLAEERMERETYLDLAKRRGNEERAILEELAEAERRHEKHWLNLLGDHAQPAPRAPLNSRILARLARTFGSIFVLALAQRSEQRQAYDEDADATAQMAADEHIHGEVVRGLASRSRERMSGMFRAGVFGANDGLVSNLALTLGIAATGTSHGMVVAAGTAGLLAGALSMAAGEYISVTSQRELLEASDPAPNTNAAIARLDVNANELELVFRARGESVEEASKHAEELLNVLTRPAGVNLPDQRHVNGAPIGTHTGTNNGDDVPGGKQGENEDARHAEIGTAIGAASSSFVFFGVGALLPLLPFLLGLSGTLGIVVATIIVGAALMITGGIVGILSGKPPLLRALRQLAVGYGAAAVTYALGLAFGASGVG